VPRIWPSPRKRRISAPVLLLGATATGGLAGYGVILLLFRDLGPVYYASFAVFWSALYLAIGGLSGLQQEFARATNPKTEQTLPGLGRARGIAFSAGATLIVASVVTISSVFWAPLVFGSEVIPIVGALVVGVSSFVIFAMISGSLYGLSRWGTLAALIVSDAMLRLFFVGAGLMAHATMVGLAWLVVAPIPTTLVLWSQVLIRSLRGKIAIDATARRLALNALETVLAAVGASMIVSGFPFLLGIAGSNVDPHLLGSMVFAITLTRAPLVITVMSLQSYLVVVFRSAGRNAFRLLGLVVGAVGIATLVFGLAVSLAGIPVLNLVAGRDLGVDVVFLLLLVVSSFLIAVLSITGAFVLAEGSHRLYLAGWAVATVVTIAILFGAGPFMLRLAWSLVAGPTLGIGVHLCGRRWMRKPQSAEQRPGGSVSS
jgi:O-antigen/teichoic acid export membrane protein